MADLRKLFGENLRRAREKNGLSSVEFAKLFGVKPPYVTQMEQGKTGFSADSLFEASKILGVSAASLIADPKEQGNARLDLTMKILQKIPPASEGTLEAILDLLSDDPSEKAAVRAKRS